MRDRKGVDEWISSAPLFCKMSDISPESGAAFTNLSLALKMEMIY